MTGSTLDRAADAARAGDLGCLQAILSAAPEVLGAFDEDGNSLLVLACRAATRGVAIPPEPGTPARYAAVELILAAGADPAPANPDGWAPLHVAAMSGDVGLAERLLAAGAPRAGRLLGCAGGSPLALALFYAKGAVAQVLATPPVPDNLRTAAALGRDFETFVRGDVLLPEAAVGLDFYRPLKAFPAWQRTGERQELLDEALSWAARNSQLEAMARLVALGADVNANAYRGTPLLWACYDDRVDAAAWLLDHGADPDLRHDFGGTGHGVDACAMHLAAQFSSLGCLRLLIDRGADTQIADGAHGGRPLDWARHGGAEAAARLLEGAPA